MDETLRLELGASATIVVSGEVGTVVGVAVYQSSPEAAYLLRYKKANGVASEEWWNASALARFSESLTATP